MDAVAVISASGKPLMPTNPMRARKLIKKGKAVIYIKTKQSTTSIGATAPHGRG